MPPPCLVLVIGDRADAPAVAAADLERTCEAVVRLVLSHVVRPGAAPDVVAHDVGWLVRHVLAGATAPDPTSRGPHPPPEARWPSERGGHHVH